jgi:hypothetical protein
VARVGIGASQIGGPSRVDRDEARDEAKTDKQRFHVVSPRDG